MPKSQSRQRPKPKKPATLSQYLRQPSSPKRTIGFLSLPGEIRNIVYEYYFEDGFRAELAAKGAVLGRPKLRTAKLFLPIHDLHGRMQGYRPKAIKTGTRTIRVSRKLGARSTGERVRTKWSSSLCPLILVCKRVYQETMRFLYQSTTFVFTAPWSIMNFLNTVPQKNLAHITKIQMHYSSYGHPEWADLAGFKEKHIMSWTKACKSLSEKLTSLRELEIWYNHNETCPHYSLYKPSLRPLYQFRRLSCSRPAVDTYPLISADECDNGASKPLRIVNVHFSTAMSRELKRMEPLHRIILSQVKTPRLEMHRLFGETIASAILGSSAKDASATIRAVWASYEFMQVLLGHLDDRW
ncbi:uncharacterized protein EI97DRAFT_429119 [Westerdykella ornata]|uniref:DUF7730 domain-containing protein n=1 Tax=Westerdykella ornata TaxID=318751 RepID=A0A6A6JXA6_WESOR|nr:uncharacterized protein EI97DRAFT_429119 [Westerdykella ornata]KAF2281037.1 hypothetical protein EI97DRAFT_429119 [Westerdykella ornata]